MQKRLSSHLVWRGGGEGLPPGALHGGSVDLLHGARRRVDDHHPQPVQMS